MDFGFVSVTPQKLFHAVSFFSRLQISQISQIPKHTFRIRKANNEFKRIMMLLLKT